MCSERLGVSLKQSNHRYWLVAIIGLFIVIFPLVSCAVRRQISSDVKVSGGNEVLPGDVGYLSTVGLGRLTQDSVLKGHCSGSLISTKIVLTAAHCGINFFNKKPNPPTHVLFGRNLRDQVVSDALKGLQSIKIVKWLPHPDYNPKKDARPDVAIAVLETAAPSGWQPASFLQLPRHFPDGTPAVILGFGMSETSEYGDFRSIKTKIAVFRDESDNTSNLDEGILSSHTSPERTPCQGDSGGPVFLLQAENNQWILAGITVDGSSDCLKSNSNREQQEGYTYDQFLGVKNVTDWIASTLSSI